MRMLPHFAKLHAELPSVAAFQQTQLHAELSRCKQVLLERGASNTFDLGAQSRPAGVRAAPACAVDLSSALPLKLISLQSRTSPQRLHHSSLRLMQLLSLDAAPHPPLPPLLPLSVAHPCAHSEHRRLLAASGCCWCLPRRIQPFGQQSTERAHALAGSDCMVRAVQWLRPLPAGDPHRAHTQLALRRVAEPPAAQHPACVSPAG